MEKNKINITAHAGCMGTEMDSLESITEGIKHQADIIEIDLNENENEEGELILSHNVPEGDVQYKKFGEVLELIKEQNVLLNIDVKKMEVIEKANKIISDYDIESKTFFTGINFKSLIENIDKLIGKSYFINLEPPKLDISKIHTKSYLNELMMEIKSLKAIGVNIFYELASVELVEACRENGLLCSVWTVDEVSQMERMISLRVNSITTKKVDVLKNLLGGKR
ncbi:glycerophosphodiester phosphodiesterase [Clostridium hydrogenum]|uniref:glycerophosphodiester phosphodiesterase n=1 Tax=Clostridium hydrogenum TaxID=2855764 RepID=UPI001F354317|nr:glycerophosphodiester phosphodiesterase [Clostridium hydrogenum]